MKKRILSIILSLCMTMTMVLSMLPLQAMAQELPHSSHAHGQDAALHSVAAQNIGPDEAAVDNDLYEKMAIQASFIKLIADIDIGTLSIGYEVTIDLNGHVLRAPSGGSVIKVEKGGHLTIIDSNPTVEHKFTPNADGLWVLDETNGTKTVKGGVITGGAGSSIGISVYGGGVYVDGGGTFTMNGGNIVGCTASTTFQARGGGTFNGRVVNLNAITDGTFNGEVVNDGTISGGTFNGVVTNYGTISEGVISGITVTYQVKGGVYATQIVPSGRTAIKPVDPTNSAGATFLGWYRADGTAYDFTQTVTENTTLTARFAAVTRKVETKEELTAALADDTVDVIKLGSDIEIDATLIVDRAVTLDLVGYMLEMKGSGSVITIKDGGHLTLVDSDLTATYYFTPDADGLWKWGTSGTKTVNGGVIYGGGAEQGGGV